MKIQNHRNGNHTMRIQIFSGIPVAPFDNCAGMTIMQANPKPPAPAPKWFFSRALSLMLSPALLCAACSSAPARDRLPPAELPDISFLLPAPVPLTGNQGEFERGQALRLFSAPVLDPLAIEGLASRYESRSREILRERRTRLIAYVCSLPVPERGPGIRGLEALRQDQWQRWQALQERYETSLRYRLKRGVHPDSAGDAAELASLLRSREAVQALQAERQKLVMDSYGRLLNDLATAQAADAVCPPPLLAGADDLPDELLYLPYYLALYRFLQQMPAEKRAELLLSLHSGQTSDN
jgi:hypothetical protein